MEKTLIKNAKNGNLEMVKFLLKEFCYSITNKTLTNKTLYVAAKYGHVEIVKLLLNYSELDKEAALHIAIKKEHIEIITILIHYVKDDNCEALSIAFKSGNAEIVQILMDEYKSIYDNNKCVFLLFAEYGYLENLKSFAKNETLYGEALSLSAANGHLEIVSYLIMINHYNYTFSDDYDEALLLSILNGHIEIVKILIKICKFDRYELQVCIKNNRLDIFTLLIGDSKLSYDVDLLCSCIDNNRIEFVSFLLQKDDFIYVNDHYPLKHSLINDNQVMIKFLLTRYKMEDLKKALSLKPIKNRILDKIANWNLSEYHFLIQALRECGINVYDLLEKEII